ncbi:MAG: hypothetical protein ABEJ93_00480 [Candidatus Nanohalobium sp.]
MKGQLSIEFLASFFLYLTALVLVFQSISSEVPELQGSLEQKALNIEMRKVTEQMLTQPGYHDLYGGGTNWEKNDSTVENMERFGLASERLVVLWDKLGNISTAGGTSKVNYTTFRKAVGADNQYHFSFVMTPLVDTSKEYPKGNVTVERRLPGGGIAEGRVREPNDPLYQSADPTVHWGAEYLSNETKYFIVPSFNGKHNLTYVSNDWNFTSSVRKTEGDRIQFGSEYYNLTEIQGREYERGSMIVLERKMKEFGPSIDRSEEVQRMNRYVSYKGEVVSTPSLNITIVKGRVRNLIGKYQNITKRGDGEIIERGGSKYVDPKLEPMRVEVTAW